MAYAGYAARHRAAREFRHDVVMRVARLQHEQARARKFSFSLFESFRRVFSARLGTVGWVTVSILLLTSLTIWVPKMPRHWTDAGVGPNQPGTVSGPSRVVEQPSDVPAYADNPSGEKLDWQSRSMGRNTLWLPLIQRIVSTGARCIGLHSP